ncbi:3-oxo-tetronate kinase [Rhodococcoides kyotonense]|uniref:3-oxo-tetronate kinase n=1 Tax=Rhodococcoides kyotonense TaxID=398843 RepID=A0A239MZK0_9NOCA|nr:3-oxo-tetronate kinase [Rhodococcus kyotonensis]SNT47309.1 Uncharacterized conserved protein YgbK, DUF1537 family [Rhodococcus kyotonensis]
MIGAIADDFTGATDIAVAFRRQGLKTTIIFRLDEKTVLSDSDAVVIALKIRTIDAVDAVDRALTALHWLQARGAKQILYKYCSTFDSRPDGNIGPVVDALSRSLNARHVIFVPASPQHGRTQYMGHLFVDRTLLSESPMRHHPLTPMRQSHLPTVLSEQTEHDVALIDHRAVAQGPEHIVSLLKEFDTPGSYVLIDALDENDLRTIGSACANDVLITGAAGLAAAVGEAHARHLGKQPDYDHSNIGHELFPAVALAGSCSARTLEQIEFMKHQGHPAHLLNALETPDADLLAHRALGWYDEQTHAAGPLIYSSLPPTQLHITQQHLGTARASSILEAAMGLIASGLVDRGARRLIVAGGETSGAVVTALNIDGGVIGPEAATGVPWIRTTGTKPIDLLLKSGNFGEPDLLTKSVGKENS